MPDETASERRGSDHLALGLTARQLEVFAAVLAASDAKDPLLPGAAERVGVKAGTISQTLRLLERNLGDVKLTETAGRRSLRLTAAATELAPSLAELLEMMSRFTSAAGRIGSTRSLRVSCYPAHLIAFVGRALTESDDDIVLAGVTDDHRAGSGEKALVDLIAGRTDMAIAPTSQGSNLLEPVAVSRWHLAPVMDPGCRMNLWSRRRLRTW